MAEKIYGKITDLVGKTPLLELCNIEKKFGLKSRLLVKLEYLNPAGSVKDRVGKNMIDDALLKGQITRNSVIIEPTSGNTGIGLAMTAACYGMKLILTMPDTMSRERIALLKAYGAEIVLTDGKLGMKGAVDKANEICKTTPGSIVMGQFDNPVNPETHYKTTGPEIFEDTDGKVDVFVATFGTGGTLSGTGKYLKEKNPGIKIIGVEPLSSPLVSEGKSGPHKIQGIGANFVPENLDRSLISEICKCPDESAFEYAKLFGIHEGFLVGISSGAALYASILEARKPENEGKTIVAILPDSGDRYLSTELFA